MEPAMEMTIDAAKTSLAPNRFVSEVEEFRETIADPSLSLAEKKRAYGLIVKHAALLDPADAGFWRAGVALKVALCACSISNRCWNTEERSCGRVNPSRRRAAPA